ncbi:hypothetical protein LguiA_025874 [Lonicera macranthoides]
MWRRAPYVLQQRQLSSQPENPMLYSFLQPSIFALKRDQPPPSSNPPKTIDPTPLTLTSEHQATLESTLQSSLNYNNTDQAWKSFKTLTKSASFPCKPLTNSLITHLSLFKDTHNLKRASATMVFLLDKNPKLIEYQTVETLLNSMKNANTVAPAFSLVKCMFKNRYFMPFSIWGSVLVEISRKNGSLSTFLQVFNENCRIGKDEKLNFMKPNLAACNVALEGCCCDIESIIDAENVVETMAIFGGLQEKISELESLMSGFGFSNKTTFISNLISGYVKLGNLESISATILRSIREGDGQGSNFSEATYSEVVNGFLQNGSMKDLASLIIEAQKLELPSIAVNRSVGYGIISTCVKLDQLDKAHIILDEMNAQGGSIGLGVYVSILNAYCKE